MSLAEILRPQRLDDILGQEHLLGDDAPLGRMVALSKISSMILWGPPGSGKTTIARLLGQVKKYIFVQALATSSGVVEFRKIFAEARTRSEKTSYLLMRFTA